MTTFTLAFLFLSCIHISHAIQVPSIVRSPYLNLWTPSDKLASAAGGFPEAIFGSSWSGAISVNNVSYQWWGDARDSVTNTSILTGTVQITPTRTTYFLRAGVVDLNVTAFSPIEPTDPVKQSLPIAYLSVTLRLFATEKQTVRLFSSIDGAWGPGPTSLAEAFRTVNTGHSLYFHSQLYPNTSTAALGEDLRDSLTNVVYGMSLDTPGSITQCTGNTFNCYDQFLATGKLFESNTTMSNPIVSLYPDRMQLGTSFAVDVSDTLLPGESESLTITWAIGSMRDPVVTYKTPSGVLQQRSPYYRSQFSSISSIVDSAVSDFSNATTRADELDKKLTDTAKNTSDTYAQLVALSARAVMGATELTISNGTDGNFNTSDAKLFMLDVGVSDRVNPVDTLYTAFPFFVTVNPAWLGQLLEPLLEYQSSIQYELPYAALDIGQTYPNATGDNQAHNQGLDQSGNMLIMSLAYARASNDTSFLAKHYTLLKSWANYITSFQLVPVQDNTTSSTSTTTITSTNLALKGIIGIKSMSEISTLLGFKDDASEFAQRASNDSSVWNSVALSSDSSHILPIYGETDSKWAQIYNLFVDKALGMNLVNSSIYDAQTKYYRNMTYAQKSPFYGIPLDSSSDNGNAAFTMFTAASVTDGSVRDVLYSALLARANATDWTNLPTLYNTTDPVEFIDNNGNASPALGASFAQLALSVPQLSTSASQAGNDQDGNNQSENNTGSSRHNNRAGAIAGGVIGGLALLALLVIAVFFWRRRYLKRQRVPHNLIPVANEDSYTPTPFTASPSTHHLISPTSKTLMSPDTLVFSPSGKVVMQPAPQPSQPMSEKAALVASLQTPPSSQSAESQTGGSRSPSDIVPPIEAENSSEVEELRVEMERLRQEVTFLHADRVVTGDNNVESLPRYGDS
ncbi:hypothetical protein QCA50_010517 [Cerrena zonata]|uniref:DUF1793-domain-containing protein n=1 Tax=Cerrena zonata TaxID=2478898 RepID=A0AAW0FYZ2_9APHY